ncbi:MAG: septal ring lytic transglycosylase RlpA family protein [Hyphomicrobiales bacterium]
MRFLQIFLAITMFAGFADKVHAASSVQKVGLASFYWQDQKTANGEQFDKHDLTAAHKTLPFGTLLKVTRVKTGKSVIVRINDRGPFIKGRIVDLSLAAAREIGLTRKVGVTKVKVEIVGKTAARK